MGCICDEVRRRAGECIQIHAMNVSIFRRKAHSAVIHFSCSTFFVLADEMKLKKMCIRDNGKTPSRIPHSSQCVNRVAVVSVANGFLIF